MTPRRGLGRRRPAGARSLRSALLILVVLALPVGCGGDHGPAAPATGQRIFASAGCGACHTLGSAGSHGRQGPNLDELQPRYADTVRQVSNGGNGMPAFRGKLQVADIRAVAAYVVAATADRAPIARFRPDRTTLAQCHGDLVCVRQALGNVAYDEGPQAALSRLDRLSLADPNIGAGCHQLAHEIGHAALVRYRGDAAAALSRGSMTCWSGYYHGVIERAFGALPRRDVAAKARRLCSGVSVQETLFVAYQCVHGLGHGLMIYSHNDLRFSLAVCHQLGSAWDQSSCAGGVFMQNFLPTPMAGPKTKWLRRGDLIYPCNAVAVRDKGYCYLMVTSRILPAVRYDWHRAVGWCHRAERDWVATCLQSLGRDASGWTRQSPARISRICSIAQDMERECLYGASRDITANDAGSGRSRRFCSRLRPAFRRYCFEGVGTILGSLEASEAERRAACGAATTAYLPACLRGAGVR